MHMGEGNVQQLRGEADDQSLADHSEMLTKMCTCCLTRPTAEALPPLSEIGFSLGTGVSKSHHTELQRDVKLHGKHH